MTRVRVLAGIAVLLFASCATAPPREVPQWESVPAAIVEALCQRLHSDGLASGPLMIVRVTQPLATPENVAALEGVIDNGRTIRKTPPVIVNRAIPIIVGRGSCSWQPVDVRDSRGADSMVVEISSPLLNPYTRNEAGVFARASLGSEHPAWYWVAMAPTADGWTVQRVLVLFN
jgi:hypothetical protein